MERRFAIACFSGDFVKEIWRAYSSCSPRQPPGNTDIVFEIPENNERRGAIIPGALRRDPMSIGTENRRLIPREIGNADWISTHLELHLSSFIRIIDDFIISMRSKEAHRNEIGLE